MKEHSILLVSFVSLVVFRPPESFLTPSAGNNKTRNFDIMSILPYNKLAVS